MKLTGLMQLNEKLDSSQYNPQLASSGISGCAAILKTQNNMEKHAIKAYIITA